VIGREFKKFSVSVSAVTGLRNDILWEEEEDVRIRNLRA
jgi:hypothetical protein